MALTHGKWKGMTMSAKTKDQPNAELELRPLDDHELEIVSGGCRKAGGEQQEMLVRPLPVASFLPT